MSNPRVVLGFDYGRRRIGVAVGQSLTATATPLITLHNQMAQPDWTTITSLVHTWQPEALVVGLPKNMDGSEHILANRVRRFAGELRRRYHLEVHLIDERLSSYEAANIISHFHRPPLRKSALRKNMDRFAASVILETWLAEHVDH